MAFAPRIFAYLKHLVIEDSHARSRPFLLVDGPHDQALCWRMSEAKTARRAQRYLPHQALLASESRRGERRGRDAYTHVFRKTTLQYARQGEDINRQVAADASVSETVMMTNYVRERDEELRQKSNRTYRRIAASLPPEVATAYGFAELPADGLKRRVKDAIEAENWKLVARLASELAHLRNRCS